jgi:hypothetical protein
VIQDENYVTTSRIPGSILPELVGVHVHPQAICHVMGTGLLSPQTLNSILLLEAWLSDGSIFSVTVPVELVVSSPSFEFQPVVLYSLLRRSFGSLLVESALTVTNKGTSQLLVEAYAPSLSIFSVTATLSVMLVQPLQTQTAILRANFLRTTFDTYALPLSIHTNVMKCDGDYHSVTLPWTVQVMDFLFVPQEQSVRVTADDVQGITTGYSWQILLKLQLHARLRCFFLSPRCKITSIFAQSLQELTLDPLRT